MDCPTAMSPRDLSRRLSLRHELSVTARRRRAWACRRDPPCSRRRRRTVTDVCRLWRKSVTAPFDPARDRQHSADAAPALSAPVARDLPRHDPRCRPDAHRPRRRRLHVRSPRDRRGVLPLRMDLLRPLCDAEPLPHRRRDEPSAAIGRNEVAELPRRASFQREVRPRRTLRRTPVHGARDRTGRLLREGVPVRLEQRCARRHRRRRRRVAVVRVRVHLDTVTRP